MNYFKKLFIMKANIKYIEIAIILYYNKYPSKDRKMEEIYNMKYNLFYDIELW